MDNGRLGEADTPAPQAVVTPPVDTSIPSLLDTVRGKYEEEANKRCTRLLLLVKVSGSTQRLASLYQSFVEEHSCTGVVCTVNSNYMVLYLEARASDLTDFCEFLAKTHQQESLWGTSRVVSFAEEVYRVFPSWMKATATVAKGEPDENTPVVEVGRDIARRLREMGMEGDATRFKAGGALFFLAQEKLEGLLKNERDVMSLEEFVNVWLWGAFDTELTQASQRVWPLPASLVF